MGAQVLAVNAGVNECVSKTPDMEALIETIRRLTDGLELYNAESVMKSITA